MVIFIIFILLIMCLLKYKKLNIAAFFFLLDVSILREKNIELYLGVEYMQKRIIFSSEKSSFQSFR